MPTILIGILMTAAQPAIPTSDAACERLLVGSWAGSGAFGSTMKVEGKATYRADHSFTSSSRFTSPGQPPQEAALSGRWSARAGRRPNTCTIAMSSQSAAGSSSSTSDVLMVDRDTYRAMGIDMRRVRSR